MHDSKNRLSPGLNDNQSGPTKNLYSYSDTEEVIKSESLFTRHLLLMNELQFYSITSTTGWSITSTTSGTWISRVNSTNGKNAIVVLGMLSTS